MEEVKTVTERYIKSVITLRDMVQTTPLPSYPKITTITHLCCASTELNIDKIRDKLKTPLSMRRINTGVEAFTWSIKPNGFYNQLTLESSDYGYSKKSVKLFPNGRIHITGCYDLKDCYLVTLQIRTLLRKVMEDVSIDICDRKNVMINVNFSINYTLNLQNVITIMRNNGCAVSFNPEVYSAVKIKFKPDEHMKQVTASIFSSGCVLITGAVNLEEIAKAYNFLITHLASAKIDSHIQDDEAFQLFMGRTFDDWRKLLDC